MSSDPEVNQSRRGALKCLAFGGAGTLFVLAGGVLTPVDVLAAAKRDVLAVAGTPTSLAAIAQQLDPYDPARIHGYVLSAQQRDAIFASLRQMPLEQRQAVKGLQAARAGVILPGIVILGELMDLFGLGEVEVSEHDILRGAAIALAIQNGCS